MIVVLFVTLTLVAAVPPTLTVAPATKFVPPIVTAVPPAAGPVPGVMLPTVGAGDVELSGMKVATCMTHGPDELRVAVAL